MFIENELIYDVGMNDGADTEFYLKKGFRVVAIEANPQLVAQSRVKFQGAIEAGRLIILGCGITQMEGRQTFFVNRGNSVWSSFDERLGSRGEGADTIEVPTTPLDIVVREFGVPYYMKIDIEGSDAIALESLTKLEAIPYSVSIENGFRSHLDLMLRLGYVRFKWVDQRSVPQMRCPVPAREGLDVDMRFPFGSSGPFGDDIEGDWLSADGLWSEIGDRWANPEFDAHAPGTDWIDLHGAKSEEVYSALRI